MRLLLLLHDDPNSPCSPSSSTSQIPGGARGKLRGELRTGCFPVDEDASTSYRAAPPLHHPLRPLSQATLLPIRRSPSVSGYSEMDLRLVGQHGQNTPMGFELRYGAHPFFSIDFSGLSLSVHPLAKAGFVLHSVGDLVRGVEDLMPGANLKEPILFCFPINRATNSVCLITTRFITTFFYVLLSFDLFMIRCL